MKQKLWISVRIIEGAFDIKIQTIETLQMLIVVNILNKGERLCSRLVSKITNYCKIFHYVLLCVCVCMCTCMHLHTCMSTACVGKLEENLQELLLSHNYLGPKDWIQIIRPSARHLYLLNHLTGFHIFLM